MTALIGRYWHIAFVILVMLPTVVLAQPQQKVLLIESSTMQPSLVLGRPMQTWWDVKIFTAGVVTGKFEFTLKDANRILGVTETEEMTLNGPEQRIRVVLPPISNAAILSQLEVEIRFHGNSFNYELGPHLLRVPFASKRVFMVLLAETGGVRKGNPLREQLLDGLRFENNVLAKVGYRDPDLDREEVRTIFSPIIPADLPAEPLNYCGYDLVVITGGEFQAARKNQLEALLTWVKAGGSLYVAPDGVLEPYHLDFLRSLVADDRGGIVFQSDVNGKLPDGAFPVEHPVFSVSCGIGHVVVAKGEAMFPMNFSDPWWPAAIRPLWKARAAILDVPWDFFSQQRFLRNPTPTQPQQQYINDPSALAKSLHGATRLSQASLVARLMPEGVRLIPLSLLATILVVYVLLIGPGDYYLLGWLRLRKLTWITFPASTLLVTIFTVLLSNAYMSTSGARRSAIVCDVAPSGEVVRTNRFELSFVPSSRLVTTDLERGYFSALRLLEIQQTPIPGQGQALNGEEPMESISHQTEGRIPTSYRVRQKLVKWTPQLNRVFAIPGTVSSPKIDWSKMNLPTAAAEDFGKHRLPVSLLDAVRRQFGAKAMVACFHGQSGWAYDGSVEWASGTQFKNSSRSTVLFNNLGSGVTIDRLIAEGEREMFTWIYSNSVAFPGVTQTPSGATGINALISRTAPKGGADCDDLPLLDSSDLSQWLLVVIVPDEDDFLIYRRLMTFEDSAADSMSPH